MFFLTGAIGLCVLLWASDAAAQALNAYTPADVKVAKRSSSPSAKEVVEHAHTYLGTPYVYGSYKAPPGLDCSGYMLRVWAAMGYRLPRVSRQQALIGDLVKFADIQPADLVFFTDSPLGATVTHVGMYIGDGQFIHAATGAGRVLISTFSPYYQKRYHSARRLLKSKPGDYAKPEALAASGSKPERITMGGYEVRDPALAEQLRGVDTNNPDQFEHAGQSISPFYLYSYNEHAGQTVPVGPRHLTRDESAAGVKLGLANIRGEGLLFFSPELLFNFPAHGILLDLGFPMPFASFTSVGARGDFRLQDGGGWRDYTRVLREFRYGEKEASVFIGLSRHATATVGNGQLIRNLSPSLSGRYFPGAEFGHLPLTWQGDINLRSVSIETLLDDVLSPSIAALRLALRPWAMKEAGGGFLERISFAFEYAIDFNTVHFGKKYHLLGTDAGLRVWKSSVHETLLYLGGSGALMTTEQKRRWEMGKATLGTLWRFRPPKARQHAFRLRLEGFAGNGRDTWLDNFEYLPTPAKRKMQPAGLTSELAYSYFGRFEIGGAYTPGFGKARMDELAPSHKIEAYMGLTNVPFTKNFRLYSQAGYKGLIFNGDANLDLHYVFGDFHFVLYNYVKAGVVARKPIMNGYRVCGWNKWETLAEVGFEFPF